MTISALHRFDGPETAAIAMARDEALARSLLEGNAAEKLIRTHGWNHPALTLGRGQSKTTEQVSSLTAAGVDLVTRPTGGGWLLHLPGDLAVSLVVAGPLRKGDLRGAAGTVARIIAGGLTRSGIPAEVSSGEGNTPSRAAICFARTDRDEVHVGATKVAGVAVARLGRSALVQAAIPLVPVSARLAPVETRWDPRRADAVSTLFGIDVPGFRRAMLAAFEEEDRIESRPWYWMGSTLKSAALAVAKRETGERAKGGTE